MHDRIFRISYFGLVSAFVRFDVPISLFPIGQLRRRTQF